MRTILPYGPAVHPAKQWQRARHAPPDSRRSPVLEHRAARFKPLEHRPVLVAGQMQRTLLPLSETYA